MKKNEFDLKAVMKKTPKQKVKLKEWGMTKTYFIKPSDVPTQDIAEPEVRTRSPFGSETTKMRDNGPWEDNNQMIGMGDPYGSGEMQDSATSVAELTKMIKTLFELQDFILSTQIGVSAYYGRKNRQPLAGDIEPEDMSKVLLIQEDLHRTLKVTRKRIQQLLDFYRDNNASIERQREWISKIISSKYMQSNVSIQSSHKKPIKSGNRFVSEAKKRRTKNV